MVVGAGGGSTGNGGSSSASGSIIVRTRHDASIHPDLVACPRGGWSCCGQGMNEVTVALTTELGVGQAFYSARVDLRPDVTADSLPTIAPTAGQDAPRAQMSRLAPAAGWHTIVEGDRPVRER